MKYLLIILGVIALASAAFALLRLPSETGSMEVYFCPEEDCESVIVSLIQNASVVDCAFYSLGSEKIIDALKGEEAARVIFNSPDDRFGGIAYKYRKTEYGLMHDKFCIFDNSIIFTGSYNPNNEEYMNNIVIAHSEYLAENYQDEFDEMWARQFGSGRKVSHENIMLGGVLVENYFCPEDSCKEKVASVLGEAKESIYFMTFSFTDKDLANILLEKDMSGVVVRGVMDNTQNSKWSVYDALKAEIDVKLYTKTILHNKVFIIDNKTVVTGSYNPTKNGDEMNDENVLIIHDEEIAKEYAEEFVKLS